MYGGIGCDLYNQFCSLNLKNWQWENIGVGEGDNPMQGRFGHSACLYKKSIVIYGGEKKYNSRLKM